MAIAAALTGAGTAPDVHAQAQPEEARPQEEAGDGHEGEELDEVVVQATRTRRRVQDEPIRVDVITREEVEEKLLMRPGNIAMILSETGGVRVQTTSTALGAANVRVWGLRGRYTQLLADGLPLYGGQASSIGLLQIPPTDLGQVEVIKGAASALYGPSALGGVINLVSRRPGEAPQAELLLNATTQNGQDATAYGAAPLTEGWSASLTGGAHRQSRRDLDDDGWADIPGYGRLTLRPRLFWEGESGARAFFTAGSMHEDRNGGALQGRTVPDGSGHQQQQDSRRLDAGIVAEVPLAAGGTAGVRASAMTQAHRHRFGEVVEDDRHNTLFAEVSYASAPGATTWLAGLALQSDAYTSDTFPAFDYTHTAPAAFVQVEHEVRDDLILAASARVDAHSEYGAKLSPRLSLLYRPRPWMFRASLGRGFYAPTPFVEEIEAAGLSRLQPLSGLEAEVATTASLEGGYARGPVEANVTLFASGIEDAVRIQEVNASGGSARVRLANTAGLTRTRGMELLTRYRWDDFTVTGSYVYIDANEPALSGSGRGAIPLTPRHTAGLVAMWEQHDRGRIGLEAYYTGQQELEDNPYRSESRPYVELGALAEFNIGRGVSVFLNLENLLDVRQTKYDPLLLPRRAVDGRWTVDTWAPLEGFVANGGVRVRFGAR
ncbi:MAG: TonB-dependent receptor [Proteobacteria bacterium]|nr:TonB-dependent receptor [Pseudomonadota bacterium]